MQSSPSLFSSASWTNFGEALGVVFAGLGLFVRWVIAPATRNYMREDLKPELDQVKKIPALEGRVDRVENAIERLSEMPAALARIEGLLAERHR